MKFSKALLLMTVIAAKSATMSAASAPDSSLTSYRFYNPKSWSTQARTTTAWTLGAVFSAIGLGVTTKKPSSLPVPLQSDRTTKGLQGGFLFSTLFCGYKTATSCWNYYYSPKKSS